MLAFAFAEVTIMRAPFPVGQDILMVQQFVVDEELDHLAWDRVVVEQDIDADSLIPLAAVSSRQL